MGFFVSCQTSAITVYLLRAWRLDIGDIVPCSRNCFERLLGRSFGISGTLPISAVFQDSLYAPQLLGSQTRFSLPSARCSPDALPIRP